jgi:hypothetical protein
MLYSDEVHLKPEVPLSSLVGCQFIGLSQSEREWNALLQSCDLLLRYYTGFKHCIISYQAANLSWQRVRTLKFLSREFILF